MSVFLSVFRQRPYILSSYLVYLTSHLSKPYAVLSQDEASRQKYTQIMGLPLYMDHRELGEFLKKNREQLTDSCVSEGIEWSFIPPYSPHFGGLWEAGVKSVKHHLKRVLPHAHLLFEESNTVLCQIESILNSRPLSPLSSDPNDFLPLTPAYFINGQTLTSLPDEYFENVTINRLTRISIITTAVSTFLVTLVT